MKPQDFAQKIKAGKGWLITRNSATLADTDYENVADEIVRKLNGYAMLVEALQETMKRLETVDIKLCQAKGCSTEYQLGEITRGRALLQELGEIK